jgi:hypothetical protein
MKSITYVDSPPWQPSAPPGGEHAVAMVRLNMAFSPLNCPPVLMHKRLSIMDKAPKAQQLPHVP